MQQTVGCCLHTQLAGNEVTCLNILWRNSRKMDDELETYKLWRVRKTIMQVCPRVVVCSTACDRKTLSWRCSSLADVPRSRVRGDAGRVGPDTGAVQGPVWGQTQARSGAPHVPALCVRLRPAGVLSRALFAARTSRRAPSCPSWLPTTMTPRTRCSCSCRRNPKWASRPLNSESASRFSPTFRAVAMSLCTPGTASGCRRRTSPGPSSWCRAG